MSITSRMFGIDEVQRLHKVHDACHYSTYTITSAAAKVFVKTKAVL